jgi:hypothetical protein
LSNALACVALLGAALAPMTSSSQTTDRALQKKQMAEVVDTKKFKTDPAHVIGGRRP